MRLLPICALATLILLGACSKPADDAETDPVALVTLATADTGGVPGTAGPGVPGAGI